MDVIVQNCQFFHAYFKINPTKDWNSNQKLGVKLKPHTHTDCGSLEQQMKRQDTTKDRMENYFSYESI